jgi:hypothetical protein
MKDQNMLDFTLNGRRIHIRTTKTSVTTSRIIPAMSVGLSIYGFTTTLLPDALEIKLQKRVHC